MIIKKIKEKVSKNKKYQILTFIKNSSFNKIRGNRKKYPKIVQLPLTYKCNAACVMCNIWKMDFSNEMSFDELSSFLKDPLFKEVEAVGINGGEPSTVANLELYAKAILNLPQIRTLTIISNGFQQKNLLTNLEKIYAYCKEKKVKFIVSISLDGYKETHNLVRGRGFAFDRTSATIDAIYRNRKSYCDQLTLGCTVIKQNENNLVELDVFANKMQYDIKYRLGIENKRIESDKLVDQYSLIYSGHKQGPKEFFFTRYLKSKNLLEKFKYFSIYYFLSSDKPKRLLGCSWKDEGVTIDSRGDIYYCAVASNKIGSLREQSGEKVFFDRNNIKYREYIVKNNCDNCIHDYSGIPELSNVIVFLKHLFLERYYCKLYKIKAMLT